MVKTLPPDQVVASFDSASVLHAATAAALEGKKLPAPEQRAGRRGGDTRGGATAVAGAARDIHPNRGVGGDPAQSVDRVDLQQVAASFAEAYPARRYPAALVGSSNGALAHLAAAMQVPWLPQTLLVPVKHPGDVDRPIDACEFGAQAAPRLLDCNPEIALHHMHDAEQDELMSARMAYFRVKWLTLPTAYGRLPGRQPGSERARDRGQRPLPLAGHSSR